VPSIANNGRYFANTLNSSCYWHDINYFDENRAISRPIDGFIVDLNTRTMRTIAQVIPLIDLRENLTNLADRLDKRVNASLLIGNKHFYTSDY